MQTLDEFLHQEHERVRKFGLWWLEQSNLLPDDYPSRMGESDWVDSIMMFVDNLDQSGGSTG